MPVPIRVNGATLARGNNANPEVYATVAQVLSVSGPDQSSDMLDVTPISSTVREFILGLTDPGELNLELSYNSSEYDTFADHQEAGTFRRYKLTLADSTTVTVSGVPTAVTLDAQSGDFVKSSVTLKLSGANTRA